jgi:alkylation response protein AidB-like acyl-CoA dehydrogenase
MGWNSHPARMLILEDCKVPIANRLGAEGQGFSIAMQGLNGGRTNIASCSLGGAQWALEEAIKYTTVRRQFNKRIADFQNTQFQLATMASELFNCRLAVRAAATAYDEAKKSDLDDYDLESRSKLHPGTLGAVAKLLATEKCYQIIDGSLQLFGGYGYLYDFPLQQILRDCRVHRILEGTNEIMKVIISKDLLAKHA